MSLHYFLSKNHWKEFVIGNMLNKGSVDMTSFLENGFIIPMRVHLLHFMCNKVMVTYKKSMDHSKYSLFVDTWISGEEAVNIFAWTDAPLVRLLKLKHENSKQVRLREPI